MSRTSGLWLALLLVACGDDGMGGAAEDRSGDGAGGDACFSNDECGNGYVCFRNQCVFQGGGGGEGGGAGGAGGAPPEEEVETAAFSAPAVGRHHVWVANPAQDAVVRIHAGTLAVSRVAVGDEPTVVQTRPGHDRAVVLNRGSDEVTLVAIEGAAEQLAFFPLPHHFNAMALHPAGRFAFCWLDLDQVRPGEDASALQDVAVVDLVDGKVHPVVVGFRPSRVVFPSDGGRALFVTEDGVSIIDLANLEQGHIATTVPVAVDVFAHADREVLVTPDGRYAVSRGPGEPGVTIVDLEEGTPRLAGLGAEPTDIDLLPDGGEVLVMLRSAERAARVPIADPASATFTDLPGQRLGSAAVSPDGAVAVLFTTVAREGEIPRVTLLDLATGDHVARPVRKVVAGVSVDPTGRVAYVLHAKKEGEPDPALGEDEFLARSHGFSLLDLRTAFTRLATTAAAPTGLTFTADGTRALVLLSNPARGVAALEHLDLTTFDVRTYELGSPPEFAGVVPELGRAFVTQAHPEGRISFLELDAPETARLVTVSGYALNGRIE